MDNINLARNKLIDFKIRFFHDLYCLNYGSLDSLPLDCVSYSLVNNICDEYGFPSPLFKVGDLIKVNLSEFKYYEVLSNLAINHSIILDLCS